MRGLRGACLVGLVLAAGPVLGAGPVPAVETGAPATRSTPERSTPDPKPAASPGAGTTAGPAKPVSLDAFLVLFEKGCAGSAAFDSLVDSLLVRQGDKDWKLGSPAKVPPALRPAFGAPTLSTEEGGTLGRVEIPVSGATYKGLKVKALRMGRSLEYPMFDEVVVFDEPEAAVRKATKAVVAKGRKAIGEEGIAELSVEAEKGEVRLRCFAAN